MFLVDEQPRDTHMNDDSTLVSAVSPVAPWLGGKRNLAKRICAIIDATPCTTYAEPFIGMGGIFLRRSTRPHCEVINDYGRDVSNLFRILQRHYPQFIEVLRFQLTTRAEFNRLVDTNPETLTDLERAARFLYLQRTAFGGKVSGRNFGVAKDRPGRFNLTTLEPMLEDLHTRFSGVVIECLDFGSFIDRYDGPGHSLLPRSALLGLRGRLWQVDVRAGGFHADGRAAAPDQGAVPAVDQRCGGGARDLRRVRNDRGQHGLHGWQGERSAGRPSGVAGGNRAVCLSRIRCISGEISSQFGARFGWGQNTLSPYY